jgi:membrane-associated protein
MLQQFLDIMLHLDVHLAQWSSAFGIWLYLILFLIIFAETGLVVAPFLPGDSLLFAAGALATIEGSGLNIGVLWILLVFAAIIGDSTNYYIGKRVGPRIFSVEKSLFLNPKYLERTSNFYHEHGIKTVIFARFMPILRTFAPFVAGVGQMQYRKFFLFSVLGSLLWMSCFLGAGFFFGNIPSIKSNFHIVIFTVIGVSFLPVLVGVVKSRLAAK